MTSRFLLGKGLLKRIKIHFPPRVSYVCPNGGGIWVVTVSAVLHFSGTSVTKRSIDSSGSPERSDEPGECAMARIPFETALEACRNNFDNRQRTGNIFLLIIAA